MKQILNTWLMTFAAVAAASATPAAAAEPLPTKSPPNIIFILADDQGWADLSTPIDPAVPEGCCAYLHTPNIDRFAGEGMRFPSGYASAPICTPTRRSIQFGMTPARQRGTEFLGEFSPQGHFSIPQAIKRANPLYRCAYFGKWGEVLSGTWKEHPEILGYDESNPNMEANPTAMGYDESDGLTGNPTGTFYNWHYRPKDAPRNTICEPDADPKRTFSVTRRSIAFMERQVQEKRPFYLQVSYYAIHTAFQARQATLAKYADKGEPSRQVMAGIAPMLEDLDDGVGQLLEAIDKLGIRDNTYVFFSSDNGGEQGKVSPERQALPPRNHPLRSSKQYVYEGGIRVPFMVRGPGVKAGAICREPVVQYDLLPTFYALAGGRESLPTEIDGGSLQPLLADPVGGAVRRTMPGLVFHRPLLKGQPHSAIRVGDFKLVITWSGPWQVARRELFNLAKDIGEEHDLADKMPQKADEMSAALIAYLRSVNAETPVAAQSSVAVVAAASPRAQEVSPSQRTWNVDGVERQALVYAPADAKSRPTPLVFFFHGRKGKMDAAERGVAVHAKWPEAIVVYPQGLKSVKPSDPDSEYSTRWQIYIGDYEDRDLKFFDAMLASLREQYCIDEKRIYSTGQSNGAAFTYLLWAVRGDSFAGFVSGAGATPPEQAAMLKPRPIFKITGQKDEVVKYEWQLQMMEALKKINQCGEAQPWEGRKYCTLYPSKLRAPLVTYIHPGGHPSPPEAWDAAIDFIKQQAKP